jgi:hypothetical protein
VAQGVGSEFKSQYYKKKKVRKDRGQCKLPGGWEGLSGVGQRDGLARTFTCSCNVTSSFLCLGWVHAGLSHISGATPLPSLNLLFVLVPNLGLLALRRGPPCSASDPRRKLVP